jgi:hypothetical protein
MNTTPTTTPAATDDLTDPAWVVSWITAGMSQPAANGETVRAYGKDADNHLVAVRTDSGVLPVHNLPAVIAHQAASPRVDRSHYATARDYARKIIDSALPLLAGVELTTEDLTGPGGYDASAIRGAAIVLPRDLAVFVYADGNAVIHVELVGTMDDAEPLQSAELNTVALPVAAALVASMVRYAAAL